MFSNSDKQFILALARQAIDSFVKDKMRVELKVEDVPVAVREAHACFVTLTKDFELRGCIGHLEVTQPLYRDIIDNAIAAATEDERFNPVAADELSDIDIEVSVLTTPVPLHFSSPQNLLDQLEVGVHGVIIRKDGHSATFLPQVWDELLDKKEFLASLCVKAGLPPSAWMEPGVEVETYQVEIMSETKP